jgi:hypothetical protein
MAWNATNRSTRLQIFSIPQQVLEQYEQQQSSQIKHSDGNNSFSSSYLSMLKHQGSGGEQLTRFLKAHDQPQPNMQYHWNHVVDTNQNTTMIRNDNSTITNDSNDAEHYRSYIPLGTLQMVP